MHTRMTVLKDPNESIDNIENVINDYWESEDVNLSERYDIDYYTQVNIEQGIDILKHNFDVKYNKQTEEVTFTLKGVVKYFYRVIREINTFMIENKPVDRFVEHLYSLQLAVQPEHPKVLTSYGGLDDMIEFARTLYQRMRHDHIESITYKVYKCYDYHF